MTRPIFLVSPDTAVSIAAHAVLISLQLKTRPHALDISPSSEHTLVIVTSHTWTVRHESELRQERPRTLVAFLPEATRCADVIVAEQTCPGAALTTTADIRRPFAPSWRSRS